MQSITLQTSDSAITSSDILGRLNFAASAESDGGAAILQVGSIYAMAEGTFSASANPASIVFATSASDTSDAQDRLKISHEGHILPITNNAYDLGSTSLRFKSAHTNALTINNAYSFPTSDGSADQVLKTDGAGNLSFTTISTGSSYTAGSGLTLAGTQFNVYGGSVNFKYAELTSSNSIPTFKYLGSGVTDTPINLEVRSSFQSATGSGTALLFQGTQGQLFSITDNLSSGTIFNVSDITGLPMLEVTASGDVEIGEFADNITIHQPVLISGGVPSSTTNKLYNNAGTLYFNGSALGVGISNVVEDTTPQLGGTLDANGNTIDMGTYTITDTKVGQWDTAYGWGDHSSAGYLTSLGTAILDGDFSSQGIMLRGASAGSYSILTDNSSNWNTAYGWGDHSSQGYATLASPTFTGTPAAPTAAAGTNTTQIATTAYVTTAISNLVDGAPTALDTLNELAAALNDDASAATTLTNLITTTSGNLRTDIDLKLENIVEDTTPQLGGTLDANGNSIDMGTYTITDAKVGQWDTAYGWGDHSSAGYLSNIVEDTTPQLGGDLDLNGNQILDCVTESSATTNVPLVVQGITSQSADLAQFKSTSSTLRTKIDTVGRMLFDVDTITTLPSTKGIGPYARGVGIFDDNSGALAFYTVRDALSNDYTRINTDELRLFTASSNNAVHLKAANTSFGTPTDGLAIYDNDGTTLGEIQCDYANIDINSTTANGITVTAAASQSADLQLWENSSATKLVAIGPDGGVELPSNTPSTTTNKLYNDGSNLNFGTKVIIDSTNVNTGLQYQPLGGGLNVTGLTTTEFAAATLVTAAEGIGSNNNDTTIPTSAAVKAYADSVAAGGGISNVVEDTTPQLGGTLDANGNTIDMGTYVITDAKVGQWDTSYGWGDHSSAGYLTSQTSHADVVVDGDFGSQGIMLRGASAGTYSILTDNSSNWNTAYGWGDHSSAGYLTAHPTISAASSSDNSGRTYIQDIILDSNGHVTGLTTATETVTDTQLSQEQVEDYAGNLISTGGTKTGITVTYQDSTNDVDFVVGGLTTTEFAAATLVTSAEGISSNNNDTTIPTSAAVKAYADSVGGGGGSPGGSDTQIQFNDGGSFGGDADLVWNKTTNALTITGSLNATTKSFLIDHPSKPGMKLQYASLEGPENGVYVRGTTDSGTITLPDYWRDLVHNSSITVTLTPVGQFQPLFVEQKSNREIRVGGVCGHYDYVVYGERKDVDKLEVEW